MLESGAEGVNHKWPKWNVTLHILKHMAPFLLQPFINEFAHFITCLEKACLLLSQAKPEIAKGLDFSKRSIIFAIVSL